HLYNHSAIIRIENTMECDKWLAKSKENLAVARLVDMEVI
ncbi:ArpT, partial [Enterococcus faecium UC7267]